MRIAIACGLVFGAAALLPQVVAAQFPEKKVLTLEIARKIVAAAESEAARNHLAGVVAVVDDGGWPILIERMDHAAYIASVELAPAKARTAALFKKPSEALEDAINHGRIAAVTAQGFTEMQGGLPIVVDGDRRYRGELRHAGARRANCSSRAESGPSLNWTNRRSQISQLKCSRSPPGSYRSAYPVTSEAPSSARTNTFEALIKESMDKFEVGVDAPATLNSDPASGHIASQRDPPNHQLPAFSLLSALSSPAILFADHAAPCRQTLGGMLLHPLSELRRAHQAGLH